MSSYGFGPVPSRRLGRSLGVDLVPFKTCTYDCIYCQLGPTTCKTVRREARAPLDDVLADLEGRLDARPDYVTLSGSGEPTLFSRIGELIDRIRQITEIPVAVLTNGSLLWREDVRRQLLKADLVIPSLDAGDEAVFRAVNRPHHSISFEKMLGGLIEFRREFRGEYWLEVFLLAGYTSEEAEVAKIVGCADRIGPDRVQLNTVARPPAEDFALGVARRRLDELAAMFHPAAEVVAEFDDFSGQPALAANRNQVLDLLRRRPCSIGDVAAGLGLHRNEVVKYVEALHAEALVESVPAAGSRGGKMWRAVRDLPHHGRPEDDR